MERPKSGEKYLHFKGKEYEVLAVALNCEDPLKKVVVYKQLYESENPIGTIWVRSLEDFASDKEFKQETKIGERIFKAGERVKKFKLITP